MRIGWNFYEHQGCNEGLVIKCNLVHSWGLLGHGREGSVVYGAISVSSAAIAWYGAAAITIASADVRRIRQVLAGS